MTQPLPIDVSGLVDPLPDPAHDLIRSKFLQALTAVWVNHLDLLSKLTAAQGALATTQTALTAAEQALTDLTARVTALETPPPAPTPAPDPTT